MKFGYYKSTGETVPVTQLGIERGYYREEEHTLIGTDTVGNEHEVGSASTIEIFTSLILKKKVSLFDVYDSISDYMSIYEAVVEFGHRSKIDESGNTVLDSLESDPVHLLSRLYIYPEYRRLSLASQFIQTFIEANSARNTDTLFLLEAYPFALEYTDFENEFLYEQAVASGKRQLTDLYKSLGFKELSKKSQVMFRYEAS
ncbi:hypothetical protein [Alteromonas sp. CYL-A6]|uniref:hypothetical protein n=1 Tax=Alteromonas nitratireducens TaxID=3390813 RepID=UPI0034BEE9D5